MPIDTPTLDLPPGFTGVALREHGDAFAHAQTIAAEAGAGTLVHVRRYDLIEFAVVLEPDEPLVSARRGKRGGMPLAQLSEAVAPPRGSAKLCAVLRSRPALFKVRSSARGTLVRLRSRLATPAARAGSPPFRTARAGPPAWRTTRA